jgi:hypothetical protein
MSDTNGELKEEIERLRKDRDLWMHRSNEHAMAADNLMEQVINLRAYLKKLKEALDEKP